MNPLQDTCHWASQLREEVARWLQQSLLLDGPGPHRGGEDEANYALAWFPHYLVTADPNVEAMFRDLLAALERWVGQCCVHGYPPSAEVHHGPEPFLLFLPRYQALFPGDRAAARLIEDAAHHIGNWVAEIPAWYDYDRDSFRSYRIGARDVGADPAHALELAEHFRFIHIALAAYRITLEPRYLEWSLRYGRKRAQRILDLADRPIPVAWDRDGRPVDETDLVSPEQRAMAGSGHHVPGDPLAGIENFLASGVVHALGDLGRLSGDEVFRHAARRIVEPLIGHLPDPYGDPGTAAVGYFRTTWNDTSLDDRILAAVRRMPEASEAPLAMVLPQEYRRREPGVGKRSDMIYWGQWSEDGSVRPCVEPSAAALTLAYQVTGDPGYARRAFRLAATRLRMARRVLRGGREHADMGGAVCSVAAGHGRNWGCGAVTGCYGPLLLGTSEILSRVTPRVEFRDVTAVPRLPDGVLSLITPPVGRPGTLLLFNGRKDSVTLSWRRAEPAGAPWATLEIAPGRTETFPL